MYSNDLLVLLWHNVCTKFNQNSFCRSRVFSRKQRLDAMSAVCVRVNTHSTNN